MIGWLKKLYVAPLRLLAWLMQTYKANRHRLEAFLARPSLAKLLRAGVVATAVAWLLIAMLASDEHGKRLERLFGELYPTTQEPLPAPGGSAEESKR